MITPNDLKLSYKEFLSLVEVQEQLALKEWKSEKLEYKDPFIKMWIDIDNNLIENSYLAMLEESYKKQGWKRVKIVNQKDDKTGSNRVFIFLCLCESLN